MRCSRVNSTSRSLTSVYQPRLNMLALNSPFSVLLQAWSCESGQPKKNRVFPWVKLRSFLRLPDSSGMAIVFAHAEVTTFTKRNCSMSLPYANLYPRSCPNNQTTAKRRWLRLSKTTRTQRATVESGRAFIARRNPHGTSKWKSIFWSYRKPDEVLRIVNNSQLSWFNIESFGVNLRLSRRTRKVVLATQNALFLCTK